MRLATGGLVIVLVAYPLLRLFATAAEQGVAGAAQALTGVGTTRAVANTVWTAVAATSLALAGGLAAALVTERSAAPGRRLLRAGMVLPLLIPAFVTALGWSQAYGPAGLIDDLFGFAIPGVLGALGVTLAITGEALPLAYLVCAAGFATRAEPDLERAARASGATAFAAFRTITLPLLRPALVGGAILAFVTAVNSFAVPAVLGTPAGFATITTRIYSSLAFSADPAAFTEAVSLAALLVLLTLSVVAAASLAGLDVNTLRTSSPAGGGEQVSSRAGRLGAAGLVAYLVVTTGIPLLALALTAMTRATGLPPLPANWTFANFATALEGGHAAAATAQSLILAVAAATILTVLGGVVAGLERRHAGHRGSRSLGRLVTLTFAVPGSTLAVAVLLAYGRLLAGSLLLILVAYLAKLWALGHRPIAGATDRLPADLPRAARASGASSFACLRTVVLPILSPALAAAWLLVYLHALQELAMSSLLYGPGTATLAVVVLNLQQVGGQGAIAALAVLLTVVALVPVLGLAALWRRLRQVAL